MYLSCEGDGEVIVQACITIGSAPFDTLNGTYKTFEFYFLQSCKGKEYSFNWTLSLHVYYTLNFYRAYQ